MAAVEHAVKIDLRGGGRTRRRKLVNRVAEAIAILAAAVAVAMLVWVVWSVAERGASLISWSFLTGDLPIPFSPGVGGIGPLIVGSAILVGLATAMALPAGVLIAVFLEEAVAETGDVAPALANHWHEAGELERAGRNYVDAGDQANRGWAKDEAATYYLRALSVIPEDQKDLRREVTKRQVVASQAKYHMREMLAGRGAPRRTGD